MVWPTSDQKGEEARARGTGVGGQASLAGRHSLWMDFHAPFSGVEKPFLYGDGFRINPKVDGNAPLSSLRCLNMGEGAVVDKSVQESCIKASLWLKHPACEGLLALIPLLLWK